MSRPGSLTLVVDSGHVESSSSVRSFTRVGSTLLFFGRAVWKVRATFWISFTRNPHRHFGVVPASISRCLSDVFGRLDERGFVFLRAHLLPLKILSFIIWSGPYLQFVPLFRQGYSESLSPLESSARFEPALAAVVSGASSGLFAVSGGLSARGVVVFCALLHSL